MADKRIFVGNGNDKAIEVDKIYVGDSNNKARLVSKVYVGNSSNKAVQVWPPFKWTDVYQKCQYIYNTGRAEYILTGIYPSNYTRFVMDFQIQETDFSVTGFRELLGVYQGSYLFGAVANTSSYIMKMYFDTRIHSAQYDDPVASKTFASRSELQQRHTIDFNRSGGTFYIDNSYVGSSTKTFSALEHELPLFAIYGGNYQYDTSDILKHRLYSFQAYNNNVLIRDMIPCYRKSDIEIGMYDLVNDVFYTNSGSGTFYKGPDVN